MGSGHTYTFENNMIDMQLTYEGVSTPSINRMTGIQVSRGTNATVNINHNSVNMIESLKAYPDFTSANCFGIGIRAGFKTPLRR